MNSKKLEKAMVLSLSFMALGSNAAWAAGAIYYDINGIHNVAGSQDVTTMKKDAFGGYPAGGSAFFGVADAAIAGKGNGTAGSVTVNFTGGTFGVDVDNGYNAGTNDAHGIGAYDGAQLNFGADTTLVINNAAAHSLYDNHGIVAGENAAIIVDSASSKITLSNGSHNSGLRIYKNGSITVANPLTMDIMAGTAGTAGSAYGIAIDTHNGTAADKGYIETGAVKMTLKGSNQDGTQAVGIAVTQDGSYKANGYVDITAAGTTNNGKFAGIDHAGTGSVTVQDVKIKAGTSGAGEAFGVFNSGGGSFSGGNLDITAYSNGSIVNGIINQSLDSAGKTTFTTGNITMDLAGTGSEVYGILNGSHHGTLSNNAVDFLSGNIRITADNDGNLIGITNKAGSTFAAKDINISGSGKWYMVGIENQTGNQIGMENLWIDLEKKDGSGGKMIGVSTPWVDMKSKNATVQLDNSNGTDTTIGIDVGTNKADVDGDLYLEIKGNDQAATVGVNGKTNVTGSLSATLAGGKAMTAINGDTKVDEDLRMSITGGTGDTIGINGALTTGGDVIAAISGAESVYGVNAGSKNVTVGGNVNMDLAGKNGIVAGIASTASVKVDGNFNVNIHDTDAPLRMAAVIGNQSQATHITIGGRQNNIFVQGTSDFAEGLFGGVKLADNSVTNILVRNTKDSFWQTHGVYDRNDTGFSLGANAVLNVDVASSGLQQGTSGYGEGTFGLLLTTESDTTESVAQSGSQINVTVQGSQVSDNGYLGTVGVSGTLQAAGDVKVDVKSENGIGLRVVSVGDVAEYTGDVVVTTNKGIAVANVGRSDLYNSKITIAPTADKKVQLLGDVKHFTKYGTKGALIDIRFKNAASFLTGASIGANLGNRKTVLDFDNGSRWNMTGDSVVTELTNSNDATIDMTQGADKLDVTAYSGDGGNFVMDTDLASETNGDKIAITGATAGITYVQVKDSSLLSGIEVAGNKSLLLITDTSEKATFTGKHLNAGGLWDVTPTIENGIDVIKGDGSTGSKNEWYLTKIEKQVNNDTEVLLNSSDNSYALWRNTNDSLRKRLGDLRYRANKTDGDGIWARYSGGKFAGSGFDSSYNMYQLGYDKADNAKSTYGFAVESGTGHADYSFGSGKDKLLTGSLYGTWYGDRGSYTDVVARIGQFDTDIASYGDYPDKASNKNPAYSLSVEYGKTLVLSKKAGTFIEPQAQLIMGRLGSSSYTTDRGNNVYLSGLNSYIGRVGFVLGQKTSDGNDVYFKANLLREFGGSRTIDMRAANGEMLTDSKDYGDTWFEIGVGTNINLSRVSHFYGDIERSFGADIKKKWQINAGVRFEF